MGEPAVSISRSEKKVQPFHPRRTARLSATAGQWVGTRRSGSGQARHRPLLRCPPLRPQLVTVFSASNYCESKGNHGGLVVFDAPGRYTLKEFWAPFLFEVAELLEANLPDRLPGKACAHQRPSISAPLQQAEVDRRGLEEVRASLRGMIAKRVDGLERFYRGCPQIERNCVVSLADWTAGLRSVLQVDLNFEAHREALAGPDADGPVDWRRFLDQYRVEVGDAAAGWNEGLQADIRDRLLGLDLTVSEYFQLFDTNNDGQIDLEEMQV